MNAIQKDDELKRVIGVSGVALSIVSFTVGAGIFVLPAIVGVELGAFAVFGYIFCGIMLAAIMLCYAEIGSRVTATGGSYAYVEAAFGSFAGFIINWLFVFGWSILGDAALLNIVADSLSVIFPLFSNPWLRGLLFFVLLSFMVVVNITGAKQGVTVVKLFSAIKLLPLIAIIIFGFTKVDTANLHWDRLPTISTFGSTMLILFYAFAGFESALSASGEIKNPKRTVPLGIFVGGMLVLVVYLLLQAVVQGVLGPQMAVYKDAPLAAVAEKIIGPVGGTLLLLTAALSCFGSVTADVLQTPRVLYAGANDGLFPKILGKLHPRYFTPHWAIIIMGVLVFIFSISGGFKQLAVLASAAILLIYLAVILSTIKLRRQQQQASEKTFKAPGGLVTPLIGIGTIVWLLSSLSKWEILSTLIFIAVICVIYFVMRYLKKEKIVVAQEIL